MKRLLFVLAILSLTVSCTPSTGGHKTSSPDAVDSLKQQITILKEELRKLGANSLPNAIPNEDFQDFINQFMTDSLFQLKRVQFPLPYVHWKAGYPGGEIDTVLLSKRSWKHEPLYSIDFSYIPQVYDNFEGTFGKTNRRLLHFMGVETGVNAKYYFEAIDNRWFLIKMENLGD